MEGQCLIADARQLNSHPTGTANVRRFVVLLRRFFDQCLLDPDRRGDDHSDVTIVVMIVGKHGKYFLAHKPRRLAMRDLFPTARQRQTDAPDTFDLLFTLARLWWFSYSLHQNLQLIFLYVLSIGKNMSTGKQSKQARKR